MMRTLLLPLVVSVVVMAAEAADLKATMEVVNNNANGFEGRFCFHLPQAIQGWELVIVFSSGVNNVGQWQGDWIEQHGSGECATHWTLVNKNYMGKQNAGDDLCVKVTGSVCGGGKPGGTATFVDLNDDHMHVPAAPKIAGAASMKYNYPDVLMKSILFYEAQRSGKLPHNNRITWRGDSALKDKGAGGEDLTGGWYDAGDNVKFNFPMAFSTTVLCWSLLEFPQAYSKTGQLDHMYDSIRWPLEYFIKCHTKPEEIYVQVGNGGLDHAQWTRPESMDQNRPAYKIDASSPGSDVSNEMAAAMACGSIAFKTKDPAFSRKLLTASKSVYAFAKKHQGIYSASVQDAAAYYQSSNYTDENNWGAAWLYKATNDNQYLADAKVRYAHEPAWGFSWDEKIAGNHLLMYSFTKDAAYKADIESTMTLWSKQGGMKYSPKCLAFRLQWGALRYSSNTAFFALMAAKQGIHAASYRQWAMCQINYALGDTGRSYVVGFGTNPPKRPHHRASSCPMMPIPCSWDAQQNPGPNPHTLYGSLVGGPGGSDDYTDSRIDYIHNEVACDYNAGFQGAVAALIQLAIDHELPNAAHCGQCPMP
ncbi:uncharacterized protein [Littorina saxatilis]|uniref:Endoglucanase n=1 Tax=Littorina saxatilis TaxID=31220 RepID=A0AAN9AUL6_9CAEN